jgi:hypothetical protein
MQTTPGGPNITINGTVQDVAAKLTQANPHWECDFNFDNHLSTSKLEKRGYWLDRDPCDTRWPQCGYNPIADGIAYLNRVPGQPGQGPCPGSCGRVSCSWVSAIWWCNDVCIASRWRFSSSHLLTIARIGPPSNLTLFR